jgi:hypothetical protein
MSGIGDGVAEAVLEQAATLGHGLTVERAGDDAEELAVTYGSSTTVRPGSSGLVAPSRRVARSDASCRRLGQIELVGRATDAEPEAGLRLVAVVGERADADVAAVLATRCGGCRWWWRRPTRRTSA